MPVEKMNNILQRIKKAKHIVVIAHKHPDADSLGSASAFYTYILQLHKKVSFYCVTKNINNKLKFLPWVKNIRDSFPASADLAISFDCGAYERIGIDVECDLINIDHHISNSNFGTFNLVEPTYISSSAVVYNFFKSVDAKINTKMATALYAGLLDDSNSFLSDDVDDKTFLLASQLLRLGAEKKACDDNIIKFSSLAALRLKGIMYKNMELFYDGRVAFFCVSADDMKSSGAVSQDCEGALEEALFLKTVKISLLLKENNDKSIKGSLRSSSLDISSIATTFSGGGHKLRAGFTLDNSYTLQAAKETILKLIKKDL